MTIPVPPLPGPHGPITPDAAATRLAVARAAVDDALLHLGASPATAPAAPVTVPAPQLQQLLTLLATPVAGTSVPGSLAAGATAPTTAPPSTAPASTAPASTAPPSTGPPPGPPTTSANAGTGAYRAMVELGAPPAIEPIAGGRPEPRRDISELVSHPLRPGTVVTPLADVAADHSGAAAKAFVVLTRGAGALVTVADDWRPIAAAPDAAREVAEALNVALRSAGGGRPALRATVEAHGSAQVAITLLPTDPKGDVHVAGLMGNRGFDLFALAGPDGARATGLAGLAGALGASGPGGPAAVLAGGAGSSDPLVATLVAHLLSSSPRPAEGLDGDPEIEGVGDDQTAVGLAAALPWRGAVGERAATSDAAVALLGVAVAVGAVGLVARAPLALLLATGALGFAAATRAWPGTAGRQRAKAAAAFQALYEAFMERWAAPADPARPVLGPADPHAVLGLPAPAPWGDVRRRQRQLLWALHPDRHPGVTDDARRCLDDMVKVINGAVSALRPERYRASSVSRPPP